MTLSATEATFEGFRLTRARPLAVLVWASVWLVGLIVLGIALTPVIQPIFGELQAAQGNAAALSPAAQSAMMLSGYVATALAPLLQAVLMAAVFRAVLQPEASRFAYLRVGAAEGRLLLALLALAALSISINLIGDQILPRANAMGGLAASALVQVVFIVLTVWLGVRTSLIPVLTFQTGRVAFREGWQAGGKHFWPLLGIMIMAFALAGIVVVLLILIAWPLYLAIPSAGAVAGVAALIISLLFPVTFALVSTIFWAPFAAVARQLSEA